MMLKTLWRLGAVAMVGAPALAQDSVGNPITGEAKIEVIKSYGGSGVLPKPSIVVIQDFQLIGDVITDDSAAARLRLGRGHGSNADSTPDALVQQVQTVFSKTLKAELDKVKVPSERESDSSGPAAGTALLVGGEFMAINAGNKSKRILIGFGRGASDIKTHVTVYSFTKGERTAILEFNLNSESGKKPGAIATAGTGSLAVGAAGAAAGAGKSDVEADASRMAKAVAKQLEGFMAAQQWIPPVPQ